MFTVDELQKLARKVFHAVGPHEREQGLLPM
jgi:hypothetical protein